MSSIETLHLQIADQANWAQHVYDPSNSPHIMGFRQHFRQLWHELRGGDVRDDIVDTIDDLWDGADTEPYAPGAMLEALDADSDNVIKVVEDSIVHLPRLVAVVPPIIARPSNSAKLNEFDARAEVMDEQTIYIGKTASALLTGRRRWELASIRRRVYYLKQAASEFGWLSGVAGPTLYFDKEEDMIDIRGSLISYPMLPVGSVWSLRQPKHTGRMLHKIVSADLLSPDEDEYAIDPPDVDREPVPGEPLYVGSLL